jgi:hypothetical protein
MDPIIHATKSFNGIQVTYLTADDVTKEELFSYENLIEMKINVTDLIEYPDRYAFDPAGPSVVRTDFCKPDLHE